MIMKGSKRLKKKFFHAKTNEKAQRFQRLNKKNTILRIKQINKDNLNMT